ncbi:MAG: hypothetical protein HY000_01365 [Planctomycetes bacterium]|nr:hypothetical protein [Planctomycetota bacterium]
MKSLFTRLHHRRGWSLVALAVICCAGCSGPERWDTSGRVTYGGQPVTEGHITFDPVKPGTGGGFARIVDGHYDTRQQGRNHPGGPHRVTVAAYKGLKNPKNPDSDVALLFPAYRIEVDLPTEESTMDFDVPTDWGKNNSAK